MLFLTDFADEAVVLPVAAVVLVVLLMLGWRRGALAWLFGVGGVLGTMLVLKLIVFACIWRLPGLNLSSPSGHTAAAAVVYGGLLALLAPRRRGGALLGALTGGAFASLVGFTRLALHVHTVPDVLVGAAVGVLGAVLLRHFAGVRPEGIASPRLVLAVCVAIGLFHGHRLAAETRIRWLALDVWPLSLCRQGDAHAASKL
jgi:membrane-associated phospholipid phosphatase